MVRRSTRLRDKANENKAEILPVDNGEEKFGMESLESLVKRAYAVMKEKAENENKTLGLTERPVHRAEEYIDLISVVKDKITDCHTLASELNPGFDSNDLYFNMNGSNSRSISSASLDFNDKQIMKKCVITADFEKKLTAPPYHVSYNALKKQRKMEKEKTAGSGWFNLPAPEMTPELKRDLNIIGMRGVLDPKRHYKKNNSKKLPKYFQIGTVMDGPADFYSSRIPKSGRKPTIVEALLADADFRRYNKKKFLEIQASKSKTGRKKGFYKRSRKKRR